MSQDRKSTCLEDLRARILRQDIAPGSDLDEAALCKQYGLSRDRLERFVSPDPLPLDVVSMKDRKHAL